jgi:dTMP kinase
MKGKFLVIEGIDGCGKGTQIKFLARWLRAKGLKVCLTDEPSGLKKLIKIFVSEQTRLNDPVLDALLFTADRAFHINTEIVPALKRSDVVISDRYYHSTFAYQSTQGLDIKWLKEINRFALRPDLTIIFDVPADVAVSRILKDGRRKSFDKFEKLAFLKKLRSSYLKLPKRLKEKIVIISANRQPQEIFADVKAVIQKQLKI